MTNSNLDAEIARRIAAKSKYAVPLPRLASDDPVVALVAEKIRLIASLDGIPTGQGIDEVLKKENEIDKALIKAKPATLAGAAAGLMIAKYELETYFTGDDNGSQVILSMIEGAIGVLEREAASC
jgi:hypothetical protein